MDKMPIGYKPGRGNVPTPSIEAFGQKGPAQQKIRKCQANIQHRAYG